MVDRLLSLACIFNRFPVFIFHPHKATGAFEKIRCGAGKARVWPTLYCWWILKDKTRRKSGFIGY